MELEWLVGHISLVPLRLNHELPDPPIELFCDGASATARTGTFTNHHKFLFIGITLEDANFGDLMCR